MATRSMALKVNSKMNGISHLRTAIALVLLVMGIALGIRIYDTSESLRALKTDLATLDDVRYGVFNSDEWSTQLKGAIDKRIDTLDLTSTNREEIRKAIEEVFTQIVADIDKIIRRKNSQNGLLGQLGQAFLDSFIDIENIQRYAGQFAEVTVRELDRPEVRERLKVYLKANLDKLVESRFEAVDMSAFNAVLDKHGCALREVCQDKLNAKERALESQQELDGLGLVIVYAVILVLCLARRGPPHQPHLSIATLATLAMMSGGVTLPMIQIDARITELQLAFLDSTIRFTQQVFVFEYKSIADVIEHLWNTGEAKLILVAVLLATFSIIFPTAKAAATWAYWRKNARGLPVSPWVEIGALKLGKWSMADVFVVALFMGWLGVDGLINSQLEQVEGQSDWVNVLTTNGTHLEIGFFVFLSFVLGGLFISSAVARHAPSQSSTFA